MFARRYFAGREFAPRYFPQSQGSTPAAPVALSPAGVSHYYWLSHGLALLGLPIF